jgi:S-DNA-T family DNA segregation ATPase FtsK/SpoIIIE
VSDVDGFGKGMSEVGGFLLFGVLIGLVALVRFVWRYPKAAAVLAATNALWLSFRYPELLAPTVLATAAVLVWCAVTRHRFRGARRRGRYRRAWRRLCAAHRLSWAPHPKAQNTRRGSYWELLVPSREGACPKLEKIESGPWMDRLRVRMLPGQTPEDWEAEIEGIAHAVGARDGRIRVHSPGRIVAELAYGDPLHTIVDALAVSPRTDLGVVPVGLYEDGATWFVHLQGSHILVAGDTGSGKGSVTGSIIRALCAPIRVGLVQVWAADPKGGQELTPYRPLLARFAWQSFDEMACLLEEAVIAMQDRAKRLAGVSRKHFVTTEEPLIVVLVDELATLTAYVPDRKIRDRVTQALALLLTQGRAVGFVVVAALQDPRKDVVAFRQLFTTRVALRLNDRQGADMVLGDGARDMGAYCDRIPEYLPGVGYVKVDGQREPRRVRAAYVTDDDIAAMCFEYGDDSDRRPSEAVAS